jgi:death on curing protein
MRFLSLAEVLTLHSNVIAKTGGVNGVRDLGALESAITQPRATFGGDDLYPDILSKAATLGFGLIANHPFVDGNKRIGHAAMAVFLMLNGYSIRSTVDDQEAIILEVASATLDRAEFESWLKNHTTNH